MLKRAIAALLLSTALIAPPNAAKAAPVAIAIATQLGATGFATAVAGSVWATAAINAAASIALSAASTALNKAKAQKYRNPGIRTESTTQGEATPQTIVFGRYATAGNAIAPAMTHGLSGTKGKGRNRYLTYVIDLAELPIDSLNAVYIDGQRTTFTDPQTGSIAYLGLKADGDLAGRAWLTSFHDGRQTEADSFLLDVYGDYPETPWQDDMILTGVPYAVINFRADPKAFQGFPRVRFDVQGMRLYDPRFDSTAGGTGGHRWNDESSWEFTTNPIVMIYNLMRGLDMRDGTVYGVEAAAADLPLSVWAAAMNACEEAVSVSGGGTRPRYQAGLEFSTADEPFDVIDRLLTSCGGKIAQVGSAWWITVGAPSAPVLAITDADILVSSPEEFDPFPGADETHNGVHATYPDPRQEWATREAVPLYNDDYEAEDGGRRNVVDLDLSPVPYGQQVRALMRESLSDARRMRVHTITLPPEACGTPTLGTIAWSSAHNFYSAKLFEVIGKVVDPLSLATSLTIRERDPDDYDADAALDALLPAVVSPVVPTVEYDGLEGFAVSGAARPGVGGGSPRPAIRAIWTPGAEGGEIEFKVREASTGEIVAQGTAPNSASTGYYIMSGIAPATDYEVAGREHADEADALWTGWLPVTTPDVRLEWDDFAQHLRDYIDEAFETADAAFALGEAAGAAIEQEVLDRIAALGSVEADLATRLDFLELNVSNDNLIREANANDGVDNWQALGSTAPVQSTDVPAGFPSHARSIQITDVGAIELPGGVYYEGANRNGEIYRFTGYVKVSSGGSARFGFAGSELGDGPGGTDNLAQTVAMTNTGWQYKDLQFTVGVDTEDFAPAFFVTPGTTLKVIDIRAKEYTAAASLEASVAANASAILTNTGAIASMGTTLRAAFGIDDLEDAIATIEDDMMTAAETNTAISARLTTFNASVSGGLTASVTSLKAAQASTDGFLTAFAGVTAVVSGGSIAGFKATSYASPGGGGSTLQLLGDIIKANTLRVNRFISGELISEIASVGSMSVLNLKANTGDINDLAITSAKIANTIQSTNYSAGSTGWRIQKNGNAEFNGVVISRPLQVETGTHTLPGNVDFAGLGIAGNVHDVWAPDDPGWWIETDIPISAWAGTRESYSCSISIIGNTEIKASNGNINDRPGQIRWGFIGELYPITRWTGNARVWIRLSFMHCLVTELKNAQVRYRIYKVT